MLNHKFYMIFFKFFNFFINLNLEKILQNIFKYYKNYKNLEKIRNKLEKNYILLKQIFS